MTPQPETVKVAAPSDPIKPKRTGEKQTKLGKLLDLRRHTDHKVTGVLYITVFSLTVYYLLTDLDWYEQNIFLHCLTPIAGVIINLSALRNFRFLAKSAENPGMFAKNRTFSYAFLVENLWFQVLLGLSFFVAHPLASQYISHPLQTIFLFSMFVLREAVPKTSYTSWEVGNNKVNTKFNGWVTFINAQVKIVRWNYVFKKTYLLYLFLLFEAEYFLGVGQGTFVPQNDRFLYYLLSLDAMHNITTAFFLQTLKFKGFISAELFALLFNASPILGVYLTYKLIAIHSVVLPYLIATFFDLYVNLEFIYPSKLSFVWKNRCQVACKTLSILLATGYMMYTMS